MFHEAETIILERLPSSERFPVIAIALADIYDSQGSCSRREDVLHKALHNSLSWSHTAVGNEKLLLKTLRADAAIEWQGRFQIWVHHRPNRHTFYLFRFLIPYSVPRAIRLPEIPNPFILQQLKHRILGLRVTFTQERPVERNSDVRDFRMEEMPHKVYLLRLPL